MRCAHSKLITTSDSTHRTAINAHKRSWIVLGLPSPTRRLSRGGLFRIAIRCRRWVRCIDRNIRTRNSRRRDTERCRAVPVRQPSSSLRTVSLILSCARRHLLLALGPLSGLELTIAGDPGIPLQAEEASDLFDHWINVVEGQGSRTVRTEVRLFDLGRSPLFADALAGL